MAGKKIVIPAGVRLSQKNKKFPSSTSFYHQVLVFEAYKRKFQLIDLRSLAAETASQLTAISKAV